MYSCRSAGGCVCVYSFHFMFPSYILFPNTTTSLCPSPEDTINALHLLSQNTPLLSSCHHRHPVKVPHSALYRVGNVSQVIPTHTIITRPLTILYTFCHQPTQWDPNALCRYPTPRLFLNVHEVPHPSQLQPLDPRPPFTSCRLCLPPCQGHPAKATHTCQT